MSDTYVFGYGSLVNKGTHNFAPLIPARLSGWQRAWAHRIEGEGVTCLTVTQHAGQTTTGVIALVPARQMADLDAREAGYERIAIPTEAIDFDAPNGAQVITYVSRSQTPANRDFPLLQSYVDVVLQGFAAVFGPDARAEFVASTAAWGAPITNDRNRPKYPRATALSAQEAALNDAVLVGAHRLAQGLCPHS